MGLNMEVTHPITIDDQACKGCHLCVTQCPTGVLVVSETRNAKGYLLPAAVDPGACLACFLCEMICPDLALEVNPEALPSKERQIKEGGGK